MSDRAEEPRSFALDEADQASRDLPDQIARLRAEVRTAKARLMRTAREIALEADDENQSR